MALLPVVRDPLISAVVSDFWRLHVPHGELAWVAVRDGEIFYRSNLEIARRADDAMFPLKMPNVGIHDPTAQRLILVSAATYPNLAGDVYRAILKHNLRRLRLRLAFVIAYDKRSDIARLARLAWGTIAWSRDEPDHLMFFA